MSSIAFAGLTAAGKTTHAQRLAADLGYDYVSATDILFELLRVPRDAHPWFNQADAISAAREDGAVDAELESRLVDLARTSDRVVFDSWALAWICPVPVLRIWIESDLPSRTRKCQVSLGDEPRPLAECEGVLRAKDDYNRAMFRRRHGFDLFTDREPPSTASRSPAARFPLRHATSAPASACVISACRYGPARSSASRASSDQAAVGCAARWLARILLPAGSCCWTGSRYGCATPGRHSGPASRSSPRTARTRG